MTKKQEHLPFILIVLAVALIATMQSTHQPLPGIDVQQLAPSQRSAAATPVTQSNPYAAYVQEAETEPLAGVSGNTVKVPGLRIGESIGERLPLARENLNTRGKIASTGYSTTSYHEYIRFGVEGEDVPSGQVVFDINNAGQVSDFLKFKQDNSIFEYGMIFDTGLESIVKNNSLTDLEGTTLNILGQDYVVTRALIDTGAKRIELRFDGGGVRTQLDESKEVTVVADFIPYKVKTIVSTAAAPRASMKINNEMTRPLQKGESYQLRDGTRVSIVDIISNEAAEGGDLVTAYFGASTIRLTDLYGDTNFSRGLAVNGRNRQEGLVQITGTLIGSDLFRIDSIKYQLEASAQGGDVFIAPKSTLQETMTQADKGLNVNIAYKGLAKVQSSIIGFEPRGQTYYLNFISNKGRRYSIPLNDGSNSLKFGDEDHNLVFTESASSTTYTVNSRDYLVLTNKNTYKGDTYIVRYNNLDTTNNKVVFNDISTGGSITANYQTTGVAGQLGEGFLNVGGMNFRFTASTNGTLAMDLTGDGAINGAEAKIVTLGGGILDLGSISGSSVTHQLITAKEKLKNSTRNEVVNIDLSLTNGDMDVNVANQADIRMLKAGDGLRQGLTVYGAFFELSGDKGDRRRLRIEYPVTQRLAQVEVG